MPEYKVTWEIDIEADTHEEAAREALRIQRDPDSIATVFDIRNAKRWKDRKTVDLSPKEQATTFEPIRPGRAPDNGTAYYVSAPLRYAPHPRVYYGDVFWPSRSYWLVPLQA